MTILTSRPRGATPERGCQQKTGRAFKRRADRDPNRDRSDGAVAAKAILVEVLKAGKKCEDCGVVMLTDGKRDKRKLSYEGGNESG